jgi:hypothetical protein
MTETKTCLSCPSYLQPDDARKHFRRTTGTPMCARFATPLAQPRDLSNNDVPQAIAKDCRGFMEWRPGVPINYTGLTIAFPDFDHQIETPESTPKTLCSQCSMCEHYVDETVTERELGYTSGFCKAKGRLILSNRNKEEAIGCEYRKVGKNATTTDGNKLLTQYEEGFAIEVSATDPIAAFRAGQTTQLIDPKVYPTDRPVTDEHKALGYRAWRRIVDPENPLHETFLPIFDSSIWTDDERKLIPNTGDEEHPELYEDHGGLLYTISVLWRELDETPMMWGEAGTGKTELARHLAWLMQVPFVRIAINGSVELDDLAGKMMYHPEKGTYPHYGRVSKAWISRCVMLLDEPNTGQPPVWQFLRPALDNSRTLVLDMLEADDLKRNDDCYTILAANPSWDPKNKGAEDIADADLSRLTHMYMTLPPEDIERHIIAARVRLDGWEISNKQLDLLMRVAVEIRGLVENQTLPVSWGIRPQLKVARLLRWFEPVTAYRRAIGDAMEPPAAETMLGIVRSHVDSGLPTRKR